MYLVMEVSQSWQVIYLLMAYCLDVWRSIFSLYLKLPQIGRKDSGMLRAGQLGDGSPSPPFMLCLGQEKETFLSQRDSKEGGEQL